MRSATYHLSISAARAAPSVADQVDRLRSSVPGGGADDSHRADTPSVGLRTPGSALNRGAGSGQYPRAADISIVPRSG